MTKRPRRSTHRASLDMAGAKSDNPSRAIEYRNQHHDGCRTKKDRQARRRARSRGAARDPGRRRSARFRRFRAAITSRSTSMMSSVSTEQPLMCSSGSAWAIRHRSLSRWPRRKGSASAGTGGCVSPAAMQIARFLGLPNCIAAVARTAGIRCPKDSNRAQAVTVEGPPPELSAPGAPGARRS